MLVLDTQIVVWLALEPHRVPQSFITAMSQSASNGLYIAGTTLWEIAWLVSNGRIKLDVPLSVFLNRIGRIYHVLPMSADIALQGMRFTTNFPKDPADRQIAATAIVHGATLVTADGLIRQSGEVSCL